MSYQHKHGTFNQQLLQKIENKVFEIKPQLKVIKNTYAGMSYFDYSKQKNRSNLNKNFRERKDELLAIVTQEVTRLLGTAIAQSVERQMKKNDSVSTTEHSASIGTTNMINSALHLSLPMFGSNDPKLSNIIVLSCSGTSFSNIVSFSRGLRFHTFANSKIMEHQSTFFGRSADSETVLYAPAYTIDTLGDMKKKLDLLRKEESIPQLQKEKIYDLYDTIFSSPHALTEIDYVDQLTVTNYYLWKRLFLTFRREDVPNYIMLSQEKIVLELLLQYHLDQDTLIHRFLFDRTYHKLIEKYFDGISGAFTHDQDSGTFLFWGISNKSNVRLQMVRQDNFLVSKDGELRIALEPDAVREAILQKKLFPSLLVTFVLLSFYYGLFVGGGTSQTSYLTEMKQAYTAMLRELDEIDIAQDVASVVTDDFVFNRSHLAFVETYGKRVAATGLDMYLYQDPNNWQRILDATKTIPMSDFMSMLLIAFYKLYCPEDERESELMEIDSQDIEMYLGLDKKLPPLGIIR